MEGPLSNISVSAQMGSGDRLTTDGLTLDDCSVITDGLFNRRPASSDTFHVSPTALMQLERDI